ncbi:Polynucleotidyl transferase- ribonuclease H-like superfamily protein [Striga hermonthica]|uniref:Polynucleotidyl transferase- ribonuclease H-like superfamily protein n=1 Tax=Striga hermonthica TaxID=68872 RepID=A0A9N7R7D4_STRHE|nr:Polynucleotidyl transferase- ribonuclease H-like superfamily protein [Striga hermonthica]
MGMGDTWINSQTAISKHAYFDLTGVSPLVFLYLLKGCYAYGTCKATMKFRALQQQLYLVFLNNPQVGPSTLIANCLHVLPIFETYCDGFSHLVLSALARYLKIRKNDKDTVNAKIRAARLFLDIIGGTLAHEEGILIKIVKVFGVSLTDIDKLNCDDAAKDVVEQYALKLIESESYMTAVDLLIHFSIFQLGESFLLKLIELRQLKAAEKWAAFLGKPMLCLLVQEYVDQKQLKSAYDVIKKNNLRQEFPELYHQSKESSLKKLAEKGVWEIAEARANGDRQLLEYLVYLAMEAGYFEKVEELCDRYSLKGFMNFRESEPDLHRRYLNLHELNIEDVCWVDEVNSLRDAISYFEECKVVGFDCEWKPNFVKGSKPSKVSIMQIASEKKVYILDLIKLSKDVPSVLDECLSRLLHSPSILKLGYNFQCDIHQLSHSYGELNCFKHFEMLLDIQNVFKEPSGGLSGLTETKQQLGATAFNTLPARICCSRCCGSPSHISACGKTVPIHGCFRRT